MLCLEILIVTMAIGDFCTIIQRVVAKSHLFSIAKVAYCHKPMERILKDQDELNARIYSFPTSAIKNEGKKINYYDFISSLKNDDCNKALLRMTPRIDVDNINKIIDDESFY